MIWLRFAGEENNLFDENRFMRTSWVGLNADEWQRKA